MVFHKRKISRSQQIKTKARKTLSSGFSTQKNNYVVDTSAIINKTLKSLIKRGLQGKIIIPHAVMAELESLANKGREEGFIGLEEITQLHHIKEIRINFDGIRPTEHHIKYAKSGEIDALIRQSAIKNKVLLRKEKITSLRYLNRFS
ncbi:hypothetical protein HYV49_00830 [Candidatus Pacearchaeota archaeon]|nr:hypothetical protein [Candidatus Pacearchaeota archaeon]